MKGNEGEEDIWGKEKDGGEEAVRGVIHAVFVHPRSVALAPSSLTAAFCCCCRCCHMPLQMAMLLVRCWHKAVVNFT